MERVIKITTTPAKYELQITKAKIERESSTTSLEISREKGKFQIDSEPARVQLDSFRARSSVSPTVKESIYQAADRGRSNVQEVNARYTEEGQRWLRTKSSDSKSVFNQMMQDRLNFGTGDFELAFLPNAPVDISVSEPKLMIDYQMDRLNFEWKVNQGKFEFIPGKVSLEMVQEPKVEIEYIGKPMYVPPSFAEKMNGGGVDIQA